MKRELFILHVDMEGTLEIYGSAKKTGVLKITFSQPIYICLIWPVTFKETTMSLSGVFIPLVMNPLGRLKYYDWSITNPWSMLGVVLLVHPCLVVCLHFPSWVVSTHVWMRERSLPLCFSSFRRGYTTRALFAKPWRDFLNFDLEKNYCIFMR